MYCINTTHSYGAVNLTHSRHRMYFKSMFEFHLFTLKKKKKQKKPFTVQCKHTCLFAHNSKSIRSARVVLLLRTVRATHMQRHAYSGYTVTTTLASQLPVGSTLTMCRRYCRPRQTLAARPASSAAVARCAAAACVTSALPVTQVMASSCG